MDTGQSRWRRMAPVAVAIVAIVVHVPLLLHPAYVYDDMLVILKDPRVAGGDWAGAWTGAYIPDATDNLYRPLVTSTYLLQWAIHGDSPLAFRAVNIALHAAVSVLVLLLARRLMVEQPAGEDIAARGDRSACRTSLGEAAAFIAAMLFAVHPIHTEVVSSIAFRTESMVTLTVLGAMLAAWGRMTLRRIAGICLILLAGLLTKEQALAIGPLAILSWWIARRGKIDAAERRRAWVLAALALWLTAGYLVVREMMHPMAWDRAWLEWHFNPIVLAEGWDRVLFPVRLLGRYVMLMAWPARLSIDYGGVTIRPWTSWSQPDIWVGLATIVAGIGLLVWSWRTRRWRVLLCVVAAAMVYAPVSNSLVVIVTPFNERLFYSPSVFVLLGAAWVLSRMRAGWGAAAVAFVACACVTFTYTRHWTDPITLYSHNLRSTPGSVRLHIALASLQMERGELDQAADVIGAGLANVSECWEIWALGAEIAARQGDFDLADQRLERAWALADSRAYAFVGSIATTVNRLREGLDPQWD